VISFDHISVRFGERVALQELSLEVQEGECIALVGPSGSGKTSALRVINGLLEPSQGTVCVGGLGVSAWHLEDLRRRTGYVIQDVGLLPHWNVEQNICTVPRMLRWSREEQLARARELILAVGLSLQDLKKLPAQLSGGEKQRVGIARAIAARPEWLLMDEPFGALDPLTRVQLRDLFRKLRKQQPVTTVLVTHDLQDAFELADRIAVLRDGKLLQVGKRGELLESSIDWVRQFVRVGTSTPSTAARL
jgi:osmoprotectant transport system ATP-binding protein